MFFFFFKQKTAYEMRISDWSSDVCSSDLKPLLQKPRREVRDGEREGDPCRRLLLGRAGAAAQDGRRGVHTRGLQRRRRAQRDLSQPRHARRGGGDRVRPGAHQLPRARSEEHKSELQSLMRISYSVFCLKK